ncbi:MULTISPECIES: hypothetical protein [unclassified Nocardia]|uniref:hypothetical protein n=1 Tax=unclassified Nocardia TaxID=2637762 RepID=UPI001CE3B617|nr:MULTISPECIES: hypothetical protein [unclassified Nocardia]
MIMRDHLGWTNLIEGRWCRAVTDGTSAAGLVVAYPLPGGDVSIERCETVATDLVWVDPSGLAGPDDLLAPLKAAGAVGRLTNPSLWDAIATAIMRQVVRAGQARKVYQRFSHLYGRPVRTPGGAAWLFPDPSQVQAMTSDCYTAAGAKFFEPKLKAAAAAYLADGDEWARLPAAERVEALRSVSGIGQWTARAAVCDHTSDFGLYPHNDLAVRTWARRLNPAREWPHDPADFAAAWREMCGPQLSEWTLLTLAWGIGHGDLDRSTTS